MRSLKEALVHKHNDRPATREELETLEKFIDQLFQHFLEYREDWKDEDDNVPEINVYMGEGREKNNLYIEYQFETEPEHSDREYADGAVAVIDNCASANEELIAPLFRPKSPYNIFFYVDRGKKTKMIPIRIEGEEFTL